MESLAALGWTDEYSQKWRDMDTADRIPARVIADFGTSLKIATPDIITAELSGILSHHSDREAVPKVGDWVAVRTSTTGNAVIEAVLPRHSEIARKVAGRQTSKQIIAANVDIAFVMLALDNDFSAERLKRFLFQLSIGDITPVIVLNKADKTNNLDPYMASLQALNLPIVVATANQGKGVPDILARIAPGQTAILLGSSGVGKSTLTNQLLGREMQATQTVRVSDDTGQHTTVHRELFVLPNGGLLIDTPGIRELQLWGSQADLDNNFDDIAQLITQCKYTTCGHNQEEGCAIQAALRSGKLQKSHYNDYLKMKAELHTLHQKSTAQERHVNKKSRKSRDRQDRDMLKDNDW